VKLLELLSYEENLGSGDMHQLEINKFADWTDEEYKAILGLNNPTKQRNPRYIRHHKKVQDLPDSVNWVDEGMVTPVKD